MAKTGVPRGSVRGPQGPSGAAGASGPTGATGPRGPNAYVQPAAPPSPAVGEIWLDSDDDAAGAAPAAFPSMAGDVASAPNVIVGRDAASITAIDHTITLPVAGRLMLWGNIAVAPATSEGYANRAMPAPALAGIELLSGTTVLVSDRDWSETFCLDNGYGQYGLGHCSTALFNPAVLAAGQYTVRHLCWAPIASNTPRIYAQRVKTKWMLVP